MTRKEFEQILDETKINFEKHPGCTIFNGLKIITKYCPDNGIDQAEHDTVYSVTIEDLLNTGITVEDTQILAELNWFIEDIYIASYV